MFQIEQSTFLHALGYAIGHSLWQMSALWLLYFGAIQCFNLSSSKKYILSVVASLTGWVAFVGTIIYYANRLQPSSQETDAFILLSAVPDAISKSENLSFIYHSLLATLRSLSPYISCAYLVVMLVLSLRLANGFGHVKQLRNKNLSKAPIDWRLFVKEQAAFLGIKKPVQLFVSSIANSPLTVGFWKPIILIPLASINQLSPQQMEAVLLHELAHIRRHDYLLNIVLQIAEISLFFNPFMRLLLKQARLERENSCDDWVLRFRYNAADYARALLAIEKQSTQSLLALGTNNKNEFQLLNRVKRMLTPERQSFNYRQQIGLLFLFTLLGLGFTMVVPKQEKKQKETVLVEHTILTSAPSVVANDDAPLAVDLVKNLENIQKITKAVASDKIPSASKKPGGNSNSVEGTVCQNEETKKLQFEFDKKNVELNEALVLLPSKDVILNLEQFKNNIEWQTKDPFPGQVLSNRLAPVFEESAKVISELPRQYSLRGVNANVWRQKVEEAKAEADRNISIARSRSRERKTPKSQEELENQKLQLAHLQKALEKLHDSLGITEQQIQQKVRTYQLAIERAQKEIAIAPFRTRESNDSRAPEVHYNYQYNINSNYWNADKDKKLVVMDEAPRVTRTIVRKKNDNESDDEICTCYTRTNQKPATVIAIDGKLIVDKLKKMVDNAKTELGDEWTPDLQKQVEKEIRNELKELEKFHIKTTVINGSSNNKALVIEIESR